MGTCPSDLPYAVDERPPWPKHTALLCVYPRLIPIIAKAAAAPHDAMRTAISLTMIALAIASVLQASRAFGSATWACQPTWQSISARR
jgi:hypothetical protein